MIWPLRLLIQVQGLNLCNGTKAMYTRSSSTRHYERMLGGLSRGNSTGLCWSAAAGTCLCKACLVWPGAFRSARVLAACRIPFMVKLFGSKAVIAAGMAAASVGL